MSRDIRSFFTCSGPKKSSTELPKRKAIQLSSDEEDKVNGTPQEKVKKHTKNGTTSTTSSKMKKRRVIESDDDDDDVKISKKPNLSKLKDVPKIQKPKPEELQAKFGDIPKRVEKKKMPASKKPEDEQKKKIDNEQIMLLSDDDFDESLINLDESKLLDVSSNKIKSEEKGNEEKHSKNKEEVKEKSETISEDHRKISPKKIERAKSRSPSRNKSIVENVKTPKSDTTEKTLKGKSSKKEDLESSVLSDEERHERKRAAAILYQKYKHRQGAINPGSKEIPEGKPNCLAGLTFVVTGVLESMEREEACSVIKDLGGKISTTVGKRLNYMVIGEEAGPKKIATANDLGIKTISEDELFNLIREKSNDKSKVSSPKDKKQKIENKNLKEEKNVKKESHKSPQKRKIEVKDDSPVKKDKHDSHNKAKIQVEDKNEIPVKKEKRETPTKTKTKIDKISPKKEAKESLGMSKYDDILPWVEKYKPTTTKQIIGQQGAASNCVKLVNWLSNWYINHDGKKKLQKPNPWAKNDDGAFFKATLLSGPPGVGKTTTAHLVCKKLGFDVVEFNASDTRSKRLLKEEVSELLSNKSLYGYFHGESQAVSKKHVLIMDEVDGMAGNEDRGGVAELISLIKDSSIPIICMCNDRNHQKMRSLVNYCYDLRFNKPRLEQIKGPIMSICFKEKIKLPAGKIEEIIAATNNDIRQTLNHLSLLAASKEINEDVIEGKDKTAKKDLKLGPWEVVRKVFTIEEQQNMNIHEKSDLFFNDYSLAPLFVQQNYLQVLPSGPRDAIPEKVALTADSLSLGDLIDRRIRSNSAWTLLPTQAMFSSVMPGEYMSGHFVGQINFPGWLGKFSKSNKRKRLAQEIHDHTRIRSSGSRLSVRLDYAPFLLQAIVRPLKEKGAEGVEEALAIIKEYRLLREDIDSLIELTTWPGRKTHWDSVDGKVKAALTRAYNKEVLAYSYSAAAGIKKKKAEKVDDLGELADGEEGDAAAIVSDEEDDDKLENDALIKAKKKPAAKASTSKEPKASDSKKTSTSKGKGASKNKK